MALLIRKHMYPIRSQGFTLIEMVLVITMLAIASVISYSTFNQYNKNKFYNIAYNEILNTLNEAKSSTLTQVNSSVCALANKTFVGYQFSEQNGTRTPTYYTLDMLCADDPNDPTTYNYSVTYKKIMLPNNITIGFTPYNPSIVFFGPNSFTTQSAVIKIYYKTYTPKTINVDTSGKIY